MVSLQPFVLERICQRIRRGQRENYGENHLASLLPDIAKASMKPRERMCANQHKSYLATGRPPPDLRAAGYVCQRTDRRSGRLKQLLQGVHDIGKLPGAHPI